MELMYPFLHLLLLLSLSPRALAQLPCSARDLLSMAFRSVSGFQPPPSTPTCAEIRDLALPSRNLSGTVSWALLRNISALHALDLSGNYLEGSIPGSFWSNPALAVVNLSANRLGGALRFDAASHRSALRELNLSSNRFTSAVGLSGFTGLQVLDLARNELGAVPVGLRDLSGLNHLDLSHNSMAGRFPDDFPSLEGLSFLNISYNNFTGRVVSELVEKYGLSAFIKAGSLIFDSSSHASSSAPTKQHHKRRNALKTGLVAAAAIGFALALLGCLLFAKMARRRRERAKGARKEKDAELGSALPQEAAWVKEARPAAPVVIFEKPLMELTFADLAAATSGFGRESQLAEGWLSGPLYRAVLPGEMHVVVRVLESARESDERKAAAGFRELSRLRHPNLLPLLGYCVAGKEKLVLHEYVERGDLHRWLHELPAGQPDVEDCSADTWEHHHSEQRRTPGDWPTRHKIALGVARGLAFLHQGWAGSQRPVVHGHLVPSNILIGEDLEPRIADFAAGDGGGGTAEGDVYDYGVVVMELVTGRSGWTEDKVAWVRAAVRDGRAAEALDPRLRAAAEWETEIMETLRVGYLCTAQSTEKRPTMQQVVGLLKDIRKPSKCGL